MHPVWHQCLYFSSASVQKVHTKHIGWEQFEFIIQLLIMLCAWCDKCMKLHCFLWQEHPTIINSQQPRRQVGPPSNLWGPHQPHVQGILSSSSSVSSRLDYWSALLSGFPCTQEHPETATHSKQCCQDPAQSTEIWTHHTHPGFPSPPGYGLMFQCIHGNAPQYLKELLHSVRSTNSYRLLPGTLGDQTFLEHLRAPQMIDSLRI